MIKKLLALSILAAMLVIVAAGCGSLPKSAVAEVNGKVITREDLDRAIEDLKAQYAQQGGFPEADTPEYSALQKQVAERLVNEEILWFEADKIGISVSDEEVNNQLDQYKQQAGGDEQFNTQLQQQNYTVDKLKDQIRKSLLFQKLYPEVTKDAAQVTDEQAQQYYDANPTMFQQPETRTVRHILVADEATANTVEARLAAGEDFSTLAFELSTDPSKDPEGANLTPEKRDPEKTCLKLGTCGSLGSVPTTNSGFVPEFEAAMKKLALNEISAPVKTSFGYHIIQVTEIKPAGQQTFAEVKEDLKQGLATENQRTAFEAWFNGIKGEYNVTYADEFKPEPTTPTTAQTTGGAQTTGASTAAAPAP